MKPSDSKYDPVRDYVESALLAESRGGVQVSRTIEEKLKSQMVNQKSCSECDTDDNPPDSRFCKNCGTELI